jgi:FkbM family methyltransferase
VTKQKDVSTRNILDVAGWKRAAIKTIKAIAFKNQVAERYFEGRIARFDMIFTDVWRNYLAENREQIQSRLDVLCEGMDEISVGIIRSVADRYFYMAPACRFNSVVAYRPEYMFTPYERTLQAEFSNVMQGQQGKYHFPEGSGGLSISVFASHNGLDFVPDGCRRLKGTVAIDGGAFIGDSALAIKEYGVDAVYCFEPNRTSREALKQTIQLNHLENVFIEGAGLGARQTMAVVSGENSFASLAVENDDSGDAVPVLAIDDFCAERQVIPSLIKLDIEGMEYDAISGARRTIETHKPVLIISVYHSAKDFLEIKPLIRSMTADYTFLVRRLDPFHPTNETVLICY